MWRMSELIVRWGSCCSSTSCFYTSNRLHVSLINMNEHQVLWLSNDVCCRRDVECGCLGMVSWQSYGAAAWTVPRNAVRIPVKPLSISQIPMGCIWKLVHIPRNVWDSALQKRTSVHLSVNLRNTWAVNSCQAGVFITRDGKYVHSLIPPTSIAKPSYSRWWAVSE